MRTCVARDDAPGAAVKSAYFHRRRLSSTAQVRAGMVRKALEGDMDSVKAYCERGATA